MAGKNKKFERLTLNDQKKMFLEKLAIREGRATNRQLKQDLNCGDDVYERIKIELKRDMKVVSDRGQGGVVVSLDEKERDKKINESCKKAYRNEYSTYGSIINNLRLFMGYSEAAYIKKTASSGSRAVGKWRCPDITVVEYNKYDYLKKEIINITTFEVKLINSIDISSVYEAMSHARRSTWSYLFACAPSDVPKDKIDTMMYDIKNECMDRGVGLILCRDINDSDMWDVLIEAQTNNVHPYEMERFIEEQIANDKSFRAWFDENVK